MNKNNKQLGFSLIELIVSLGLFSIAVTVSVGALLVLIGSNERLQDEQNVMTNLSFALDSMTREIRTGRAYYCTKFNGNPDKDLDNDGEDIDSLLDGGGGSDGKYKEKDCNGSQSGRGLAFVESGNSLSGSEDHVLYYFDPAEKKIYRKVSGGTKESLLSDGISVEDMAFYVSSSDPASDSGDKKQPIVTIYIKVKETGDISGREYHLQTTVTQRILDV